MRRSSGGTRIRANVDDRASRLKAGDRVVCRDRRAATNI